jgi:hypothetical protein
VNPGSFSNLGAPALDEIKPAPDQNDGVGLGVAILTTFVYNAPFAFTAMAGDLPGGDASSRNPLL